MVACRHRCDRLLRCLLSNWLLCRLDCRLVDNRDLLCKSLLVLCSCHLGLCVVAHCLVLFWRQLTRVWQVDAVVDQRLRRDFTNVHITWVANDLGRVQLGGRVLCCRLSSRIVWVLRPSSAIVMKLGLTNLKFEGRWSFSFLGHIVFQGFYLIDLIFNTVK